MEQEHVSTIEGLITNVADKFLLKSILQYLEKNNPGSYDEIEKIFLSKIENSNDIFEDLKNKLHDKNINVDIDAVLSKTIKGYFPK